MRRRILACVAGLACVVAGCTPSPMKATDKLDRSERPALSTQQVTRVLDSLDAALQAGDEQASRDILAARVGEPALSMRASQYELNARDDELGIPILTAPSASLTVTSTVDFPRAILNVTEAPEGGTPIIQVLEQAGPRDPYRLTQWTRLIPGQSVPSTAAVTTGATMVAGNNGDNVKASAASIKDQWAQAVLDEATQQDAGIETDEYMSNIRDEQHSWSAAIGDSGELSASVTPAEAAPIVIRDEEGGLLVATSYSYRTDISIKEGEGGIQMGGDVGALLGEEGKVTGKAHWVYTVTALFRVPPVSDTDSPIRLIAGDKVLTEAVRD